MKNKILPILSVFILVSCLFVNNNVFATTYTISDENLDILIDYAYNTDEYKTGNYHFIIAPSAVDSSAYMILLFPNDTNNSYYLIPNMDDGIYNFKCTNDNINNISFLQYRYFFDTNCIYQYNKHESKNVYYLRTKDNSDPIFYSTVDIYTDISCTEIFFQKAPVMEQELTMAQILEQNNPVQTFSSLMKNVLVSLVVFLVGLVAFFKAWTWLKTLLRQA